jgi:DnaA family protein
MQQLLLDIVPPTTPTLANYLPGRNVELLQMLQMILAGRESERFVYLWGGEGCGKSNLLQAVVQHFTQSGRKADYFEAKTQPAFPFDKAVVCVVVDNVNQLDACAQIKLFNLYNQIRDEGDAFLLVSGSAPPAQLTLRQDLVTRLGWGLVYQLHELTEEEKKQAMKSHAISCGYSLSVEVSNYLLRHKRRDLPSLIQLLDALNRYSLSHKRPITLPLLRQLLQTTS